MNAQHQSDVEPDHSDLGLTFLTALSLYLFGGQVLNGFSFALVVGIIVGTYSSIFIASPILIFWKDFADQRRRRRGHRHRQPERGAVAVKSSEVQSRVIVHPADEFCELRSRQCDGSEQ